MKSFFLKHNYFFILFLIYLISEFIVRPLGEFPLNDDWSYTKSVLIFRDEGRIDIGDWPAMTLATHILWGSLFTKIFGFSFLILRVSTWVSTFIGIWVFSKLILRISKSKSTAFIASATILFNPVFFNVTNTFMTDVNFFTLIILGVYFAYDFFITPRTGSFIAVFIISIALILLRQYGIVLPAAFAFACLFLREQKWRYVIASFISLIIVFLIFSWYESYLKSILAPYSAYKFSGNINPTRRIFWDNLWYGITTRYKIVSIHAFFYAFPLILIFLPSVFSGVRKLVLAGVSLLVFCWIYYLYKDYPLQVGNVFVDMCVGADTTYETLKGTYIGFPHFFSFEFEYLMNPLKYSFISLVIIGIIFFFVSRGKVVAMSIKNSPHIIFLIAIFAAYVIMILITESFFDRYEIPVIAFSLICFSFWKRKLDSYNILAVLPLVLLFYVAVFGTRDYFSWNTKKWEAYYQLQKENVAHDKINGGFEINCWNEGKRCVWYDFMVIDKFDYLIQYKNEENFKVKREYPFQRYFPYKRDTIRVFERVRPDKPK